MSKITSFLKARKTPKKAAAEPAEAVVEQAEATTASATAAAVVEPAGKEEWVKDVVDVEIVPVAVRKADGASDFEDEEIELPSSMVKTNFEWKRAADEEPAAARTEEAPKQSGLGAVFALKARRKPIDDWVPLEAAVEKPAAAPVAPVAPKKRKDRRTAPRRFQLSAAAEGDDEVTTLSSKDIWAAVGPWGRAGFLASA